MPAGFFAGTAFTGAVSTTVFAGAAFAFAGAVFVGAAFAGAAFGFGGSLLWGRNCFYASLASILACLTWSMTNFCMKLRSSCFLR